MQRRKFIQCLSLTAGSSLMQACIPFTKNPLSASGLFSGGLSSNDDQAVKLFEHFDRNHTLNNTGQNNLADAQSKWQAVKQRYGATRNLAFNDLYDIGDNTSPLLRVMNNAGASKSSKSLPTHSKKPIIKNNSITVKPGTVISFTQKGYCLDPGEPAAGAGEKYKLIRNSLIDPSVKPLYDAVMDYRRSRPDALNDNGTYQNLVWAMRFNDKRGNYIANHLSQPEIKVLNKAYPNGYQVLMSALRNHSAMTDSINPGVAQPSMSAMPLLEGMGRELLGSLEQQVQSQISRTTSDVNRVVSQIQSGAGFLNQLINTNGDPAAINRLMTDAMNQPVQGVIPNDNSHITELAPNVAAKTVGADQLMPTITLANNSSTDFVFNFSDYMAKPSRPHAQNVALVAPDKVDMLFESLGVDEIDPELLESFKNDLTQFFLEKYTEQILEKLNGLNFVTSRGWLSKGVSTLLTATPVLGNALSAYEAVSGKNWLSQEELSPSERTLSLLGTVPGISTVTALAKAGRVANDARVIGSLLKATGVTKAVQLAGRSSTITGAINTAAKVSDKTGFAQDVLGWATTNIAQTNDTIAAANDYANNTISGAVDAAHQVPPLMLAKVREAGLLVA